MGLFVVVMLILAAAMILPFNAFVKTILFVAALLLPLKYVAEWLGANRTSLVSCVCCIVSSSAAAAFLTKLTASMGMAGNILAFAGACVFPSIIYAAILDTTLLKGFVIATISGLLTIVFMLMFVF